MKKIVLKLVIMLLIANVTFAAGIQGEVVGIEGNEIQIEIFGDDKVSLTPGARVSLEVVPKGAATLDMLKG